ncbi:MAG: dephospho-CoA kinase [Deltaproteobacteria bacterium]|nr:dephospho-CoA kinase [Deltaproteobacteria bacterium]
MKIIGLTGGIASGKSTVASMIAGEGIPVVCADELARLAVDPGKPAYKKIVRAFGRTILNRDTSINRARLGAVVFTSSAKRKKLERIVHPEVIRELKRSIQKLRRRGKKIVVLDIPLLFEERLDRLCDKAIIVYAPEKEMRQRLRERNALSSGEIESRIASQLPIEEKRKRADIVIDNSGPLSKTRLQVQKLLHQWFRI